MELNDALKILNALTEGVNPLTGEELPNNDILSSPTVIRALFRIKEEFIPKNKQKTKILPEEAGKPWDQNEDNQLKEEYTSGLGAQQISQNHKRTVGAIQARIVKLGFENDRSNVRK